MTTYWILWHLTIAGVRYGETIGTSIDAAQRFLLNHGNAEGEIGAITIYDHTGERVL